jgi:hypothetical protein
MTSAQRQAAIARMLEKHPNLAALIPRANGPRPPNAGGSHRLPSKCETRV